MNSPFTKSVRGILTLAAIFVPLAVLLWLNRDAVLAFIDVIRDREVITAYLASLGATGPLVLMGLIGLQVLIPSLPAEPPMMAAAYAYGFPAGFMMSWVSSVAVSQAVFCLARYAGRPLVERLVPAKLLDKWARAAGERGTMFFLLAFVIPPVPSDILIYVAGLSEIAGRRFFVANFFGRMPMIVLLALVGAYGFSITPAMIVGLTAVGISMLVAWLYYVRQCMKVEASSVQAEADRPELTDIAPPQWRDADHGSPSSSWGASGMVAVACRCFPGVEEMAGVGLETLQQEVGVVFGNTAVAVPALRASVCKGKGGQHEAVPGGEHLVVATGVHPRVPGAKQLGAGAIERCSLL